MKMDKIIGIVSPLYIGNFDITKKYEYQNEVTFEGSTYRCINEDGAEGQAITNTEYWVLIAKKGDNAKINGVTTIEIEEGTNIAITQVGNKLIISTTGVQAEITTENKLDSDLIDDTNKINKFVTAEEKNAWNGKVDKNVNDLSNYYNKDNSFSKDEVTQKIASEIAKIIAEAPESFDTLKEIADWIKTHAESASAMNSAINKNKADIENLEGNKADKTELIKGNEAYGTKIINGVMQLVKATNTDIVNKTSNYKSIVPNNLNFAVKTGITTNTIELTDEEKSTVLEWIGVNDLVGDINSILNDINGEVV